MSADAQVAELLSARIKQYGNMCTHYIWPMKLYIYSDSIATRGRQQRVTAHISVQSEVVAFTCLLILYLQ